MWGGAVSVLQKLAIKLLSQPTSSSACERNWSAFDAAHTKKRKRMKLEKLQDLVYVRMNNHFKKAMAAKEKVDSVPIDLEKIHAYEGEFEIEREENGGDNESEEDEVSNDASLNGSTFNLDNLT
jgi:hAT family C-terminal dimerisation region